MFTVTELKEKIDRYIARLVSIDQNTVGYIQCREALANLSAQLESFTSQEKPGKEQFDALLASMRESVGLSYNRIFTRTNTKDFVKDDFLLKFLTNDLSTAVSSYYEHLYGLEYDGTKTPAENFHDLDPTINVELKGDAFKGAVNTWFTIEYEKSNGQSVKGFFGNDHPDVTEPYMATNGEIRYGFMNKRNELTSMIADDFKLDYVSKAIPIMAKDGNGNFIHGTFMEAAIGSDIKNLRADDPLFSCTNVEACSDPAFLKQIADIQAFDYIIGNYDRSTANMIYQVGTRANGDKYISGVKCIDHDMTFYSKDPQPSQANMAGPRDMRAVSSEMADKIMNYDTNLFIAHMVSKGIEKTQIDAALSRLNTMRQAITLARQGDPRAPFKILSDEDFGKYKITDFNDPSKFPIANPADNCSVYNRIGRLATKPDELTVNSDPKDRTFNKGKIVDEKPELTPQAVKEYIDDLQKSFKDFARTLQKEPSEAELAIAVNYKKMVEAIDGYTASYDGNKPDKKSSASLELESSLAEMRSSLNTYINDENADPDKAEILKGMLSKINGKDYLAINYGPNDPHLGASAEELKQNHYTELHNKLVNAQKAFKKTDSILVTNSDKYNVLRTALESGLEFESWKKRPLSRDDMATLDMVYEKIGKAAKEYYQEKQGKELRKRTDRGQERMRIADQLVNDTGYKEKPQIDPNLLL